ncbi:hypothetical protein JZ751_007034 [Albula glossodonta]|uniref:Uncharacterized protein n=1 Tax=Albula glossodonta TaxID=121402 RepID=A0A8T2P4I1_9TELE|nr:hypothetical protein JZ751_007034 [Albula glossodonta]
MAFLPPPHGGTVFPKPANYAPDQDQDLRRDRGRKVVGAGVAVPVWTHCPLPKSPPNPNPHPAGFGFQDDKTGRGGKSNYPPSQQTQVFQTCFKREFSACMMQGEGGGGGGGQGSAVIGPGLKAQSLTCRHPSHDCLNTVKDI